MNDTQSKIGKLLEPGEQRDAIHVAVLPVRAYEPLRQGQHIGMVSTEDRTLVGSRGVGHVGIVDPFLPRSVKAGEWFYMFLYPNTVTDMRHHWAHPALETLPAVDKAISVKWINEYAQEIDTDPEVLIQGAKDYIENGNYLGDGGKYEGVRLNDEFWDHFQVITGIKVQTPARGSFFTCSC